jgi:predicted transcriptional regulator
MLQASERKVQIRPDIGSSQPNAGASAAKRGTRAKIIIYRTEPQPGYFTSVASIKQPKV